MTRRDEEPMYQQVAATLRAQIERHEFLPGQPIPPENTLAQTFDVARITIRRALDQLRSEGLIVTTHGRGSAVRSAEAVRSISMERYRAEARRAATSQPAEQATGHEVHTTIKEAPADQFVARRLGVAEGTPVLTRRLLFKWMNIPQVLSTSHYTLDLAAGSPLADHTRGYEGNIALLAEMGLRVTTVVEAKQARMPTAEERKELKIVGVAPVLAVARIMKVGDRVVEVARDVVYPGDRVELVDTLDLTDEW